MSCCDIVIIDHGNGQFKSSPFFVKFSEENNHGPIPIEIHVVNDATVTLEERRNLDFYRLRKELSTQDEKKTIEFYTMSQTRMFLDHRMSNAYFPRAQLPPTGMFLHIDDELKGHKLTKNYKGKKSVKRQIRKRLGKNHVENENQGNVSNEEVMQRVAAANDNVHSRRNALLHAEEHLNKMKLDMVYHPSLLTPTNEEIQGMKLQKGFNTVHFVKRSPDNYECIEEVATCNLFLWNSYEKLVLCDVDGTITKTDLRGIFCVNVLKNYRYTHPGIASLLTAVTDQGYKLVYLTARAITQGDKTRRFIQHIEQEKLSKMPQGPIITSYNTFSHSAIREYLFGRSDSFKIGAVKMIKDLFPDGANPIVAGFGNKVSDHQAYLSIGIAPEKIFIIDKEGTVNRLSEHAYDSYGAIQEVLSTIFPPLGNTVPAS